MTAADALRRAAGRVLELIRGGERNAPPGLSCEPELPATGFPGDAVRIDSIAQFMPWDALIEERFMALSSTVPGEAEGLGFTIELTPQTGVTEEMQKTLLTLASVPLPVGSTIALTAYASPVIEPLLDVWRRSHAARLGRLARESPEGAQIARRAVEGRCAMLLAASRGQILPAAPVEARHFRAWLSVVVKSSDPAGEEALGAARSAARSMESILGQAHLFGRLWGPQDWMATLRELLNPQKARETGPAGLGPRALSPLDEVRWQVCDRDTCVTIGMRGIRFSGLGDLPEPQARRRAVTAIGLSAASLPARMDLARFSMLLGDPGRAGAQIPCPFLLTSLLEIPDAAIEKARVRAMCVRTRQMMGTPVANLSTEWHDANREFMTALRSFDAAGGVGRVLHQMLLLAPAGRETECVQAAQALARRSAFELIPDAALHAQALTAVLPCAAGPALASDLRTMRRFPRRTVSTALLGAPVMTEWRGTGPRPGGRERTPLLMLLGRKGQLFFADPFANAHGSYSATVVGKPGSGKSVVMNELASSVLMQGGRVWIIDAGFSYQKLCRLLGGAFLEFGGEERAGACAGSGPAHWDLNPLRLLSGAEGDRELLEMVVRILASLMTTSGLSDYAESILSAAVQRTAARCEEDRRRASIADLRETLLAWRPEGEAPPQGASRSRGAPPRERAAVEMAAMLQPFAPGGPHAKWFDGSGRPVDFTRRLTVLELDGLSAHRRLRSAVLMTLMLMIERAMASAPRSEVKLVCIDEAWDLMDEGASGRFIETGYRRARKLNGAFVTATQSVADFFRNETAEAAWRCADTRIFLRQDEDGLEALARDGRLGDDPWLREAIASLTTVAGAWSEMVIKVGDHPAAIGRLLLDPYSRVAVSTLPAEVDAVRRWEAAGAPLSEAIARVAAGDPPPE